MSGFLVDTNVISEFSRTRDPDPRVRNWLGSTKPESLYVSVLTLAEIRRGIELLPSGRRREQLEHWLDTEMTAAFLPSNILPVTKAIGDRWANLSARAQRRGIQVSVMDGLIAATAAEHSLVLATRNVKDFHALPVQTLNPWETV